MFNFIIAFMLIVCLMPIDSVANPGQAGASGLINVPSAETLDAGNICIGAWTCYSENSNFSQKRSLILPVSITLGIGSFWEVYGSYPNVLFNADEDFSGRGTLDFGTKVRFLGDRGSTFKLAADFLAQRHISENRTIDGATDISGKLIASFVKDTLGLHISAGYLMPDSVSGARFDNGYTLGVGVEYALMPRMRLLAEFSAETRRHYVEDNPSTAATSMEASAGIQYYLSPHITLNASVGAGLMQHDPDIKFIFGISSCQGIGTYVKQIPSVGRKVAVRDKSGEAIKPLKIIPISSLLLKTSAAQSSPPASKLEVEVQADEEEVLIKPYGQIQIAPQQASSNLSSPVIPVEIPSKGRDDEISVQPKKSKNVEASAIDYTVSRVKGVTPLYGVDVKGSQVDAPEVDTLAERVAIYRKFTLADVTFDVGQWTLSAEGKAMLSEVAEQIRQDKKWQYIKIDGHTDSVGSLSYNMDISLKRAIAAATFLISNEGMDASKIFIKGFGHSVPLGDNATPEGRRKNRRTEILLLVSKESK